MLYPKNVPVTERAVRALLGFVLIIAAVYGRQAGWFGPVVLYLLLASGVVAAATGFVGFCPMCYLGRRRVLNR